MSLSSPLYSPAISLSPLSSSFLPRSRHFWINLASKQGFLLSFSSLSGTHIEKEEVSSSLRQRDRASSHWKQAETAALLRGGSFSYFFKGLGRQAALFLLQTYSKQELMGTIDHCGWKSKIHGNIFGFKTIKGSLKIPMWTELPEKFTVWQLLRFQLLFPFCAHRKMKVLNKNGRCWQLMNSLG